MWAVFTDRFGVCGFCTHALSKATESAARERTAWSAGACSNCVSSSTPTPATAYRQRAREQRPNVVARYSVRSASRIAVTRVYGCNVDREGEERAERVERAAAHA
jgi:hypothetical protein